MKREGASKYRIMWGILFVLLSGCVRVPNHTMLDTSTLPKTCGSYDVYYGIPEGYQREDGTIGEPVLLDGKNIVHINPKYIGKEVALFVWIQVVGGLPNPDGSGGYSITYYNVEKEVLLRGEYNLLNRDEIENTCHAFKHRKE